MREKNKTSVSNAEQNVLSVWFKNTADKQCWSRTVVLDQPPGVMNDSLMIRWPVLTGQSSAGVSRVNTSSQQLCKYKSSLKKYRSGGWSPRPVSCCSRSRGPSHFGAGPPETRTLLSPCNTGAWGVRRRRAEQSDQPEEDMSDTNSTRLINHKWFPYPS